METNQNLLKKLETIDRLFYEGSIKEGQKKIRNIIKDSKSLNNISHKLRHKINYIQSKSRYYDEISSFAANPKRDILIKKINHLVNKPKKDPRKQAHAINDIQRQWQLLDLSSKPATKSQWLNFNSLTNTAWEPCKEYFNEIKEIKIKNALERKIIIKEIKDYVKRNEKNWPKSNDLINYLQNMFIKWQKFSPVLESDLPKLKQSFYESKISINEEIKKQDAFNEEQKINLINKVKEINYDDNEKSINEFNQLKHEWNKLGKAGKKDKNLWNIFNKNADKFYAERKKLIENEVELLRKLSMNLEKDEMSISEIKNQLNDIHKAKNTIEYKQINKDISKKIKLININNRIMKIKSYQNIFNILIKKIDLKDAPYKFLSSIEKSFLNNKSNFNELLYSCIKLEILAGLESNKSDESIRNNIQLEILSNKFKKLHSNNNDNLELLLINFINNFSLVDLNRKHHAIWKRIAKCIEILI